MHFGSFQILHYAILNVGFAAAIPTLMQFLVKMVAGISSDKMPLDETLKVNANHTQA
jgi:hypothetical protein